jgi:hypothetical protein
MDPITLIVTALAAGSGEGALEALKDDVQDAIKAAYETLRGLVRNRVCDQPGAELVLAQYEDDPGTWKLPSPRCSTTRRRPTGRPARAFRPRYACSLVQR